MKKYAKVKNSNNVMYVGHKDEIKTPFEINNGTCIVVSSRWKVLSILLRSFFTINTNGCSRLPIYNRDTHRWEYKSTFKSVRHNIDFTDDIVYAIKRLPEAELRCIVYPLDIAVPRNIMLWILNNQTDVEMMHDVIMSDKNVKALKLRPVANLDKTYYYK